MSQQRLYYLVSQFLEQNLNPEEQQEFHQLLQDPQRSTAIVAAIEDLTGEIYFADTTDHKLLPLLQKAVLVDKPQQVSVFAQPTTHQIHFLRTAWFRYAAAIVLLFGAGAYLWTTHRNNEQSTTNINNHLQADISPGGEKAILTLADGSKIILDNAANGNLAQQGDAQIVKLSSGQIAYNLKGISDNAAVWNTMSTPRGGQYQLVLPDGSKVWLNAASSVTYPAVFTGKERKIKVTGEAYLEIAKNKVKPFIVDIDGKSSIEVLGTSFNINSYTDETTITTTLLEGSVRVVAGNKSAVLKPRQQAQMLQNASTIGSDQQLKILSNADIEQTISWKNGVFNFNGADLPAMMRQLARWYDIEVVYIGKIKAREFKGKLTRDLNLSQVLEVLKDLQVNFKVEGRKLLVMP